MSESACRAEVRSTAKDVGGTSLAAFARWATARQETEDYDPIKRSANGATNALSESPCRGEVRSFTKDVDGTSLIRLLQQPRLSP